MNILKTYPSCIIFKIAVHSEKFMLIIPERLVHLKPYHHTCKCGKWQVKLVDSIPTVKILQCLLKTYFIYGVLNMLSGTLIKSFYQIAVQQLMYG